MYDVIVGPQEDWEYDWGYVARHGDNIPGQRRQERNLPHKLLGAL